MIHAQGASLARLAAILVTSAAAIAAVPSAGNAADFPLSGAIAAPSGEKLGGVTVSARREGTTITTSVYTDETGAYYFPPLPQGKYKVWAQTLSFELAKSDVDLSAARRADLVLRPMTDKERAFRQLPGEMMVAALPEDTDDDARIKKIFTNNCTGCHTPSYVLQFRFDEDGWSKIIDMMKVVPNSGVYPAKPKANDVVEYNQKKLAAPAYFSQLKMPVL